MDGVLLLSRLHWPTMIKKNKNPKKIATTFAHPDVRTCFAPHLGHASAFVLISFPHSLHLVIAINTPPMCLIG